MGYYFTLDLSGYKGKENEIYDIIIRFNEQLHKETGLSLCEYLGPSKEEINNYYQEKGIVPLLEELIWSKLTVDQQANKIVSYIKQIDGIGKDLIIIDPYIFPKKHDKDYFDLLLKIIEDSKSNNINIITSNNYNQKLYNSIITHLNSSIKIEIKTCEDIHDRFWIADNKAFLMGTSLNGLGKKIHCIKLLDNVETNDLFNYLQNNYLIKKDSKKD